MGFSYLVNSMLTQERLKELLSYDKDTGIFTWLTATGCIKCGDNAGSLSHGYISINIDRKGYLAHRLAFLYVEGYFPEHNVDHKNGTRNDNRWGNLRHATQSCNLQNRIANKANVSGFLGVSWDNRRKTWRSRVKMGNKEKTLGSHSDPVSAALARCHFESCCPDWTCNYRGVNFVKLRRLGFNV